MEETQGSVSPFAGGKAFPADMDADTMTLAAGEGLHLLLRLTAKKTPPSARITITKCNAGTVTAMLAANAAAGDIANLPETVSHKLSQWSLHLLGNKHHRRHVHLSHDYAQACLEGPI